MNSIWIQDTIFKDWRLETWIIPNFARFSSWHKHFTFIWWVRYCLTWFENCLKVVRNNLELFSNHIKLLSNCKWTYGMLILSLKLFQNSGWLMRMTSSIYILAISYWFFSILQILDPFDIVWCGSIWLMKTLKQYQTTSNNIKLPRNMFFCSN